MALANELRLISKVITLGLLITCTIMLTRGGGLAGSTKVRGGQGRTVHSSVKSQSDAPLRLNILADNSSDPNAPSVTVEVTNTGGKAIRAYSISQEATKGSEKSTWLMFADMGVLSDGLQPGQYSTDELAYPSFWDETSRMVLAVDLVEFADGTTWGPDAEQSSDMLGGRRAGEREAGKRLLKIYKERGIQGAITSLGDRSLEAMPPAERTPIWKEGFQNGQRGIAQRLKGALSKAGAKQVEEELRKIAEKFGGDK